MFSRCGLLSHVEVEKRVAARLERRQVLDVDDPPQVVAVLDEEALRRPVGGAKVMREQCLELARLAAEHPRVRLHVVPGGRWRLSPDRTGSSPSPPCRTTRRSPTSTTRCAGRSRSVGRTWNSSDVSGRRY
ncbi:hypothetical protein GCM10027615_01190 [Plantactinospora veratri]